jgi:hypothetical protein
MRNGSISTRRLVRGALVAALSSLAALTLGALASAPAFANNSSPTEDLLQIVEGETTHPNSPIIHTHGWTNTTGAQVVVSIIRGGIVVESQSGRESVWLSQVPQVNDDVTLEVGGTLIASVTYDGLPTMEATVCAGSTNFSGQRSAEDEIEGGEFSFRAFPTTERGPFESAQVTMLSGADFAGSFLNPLALGETVTATESSRTTLASGVIFHYVSENERPVGACPVPPAPPPLPPAVVLPALHGSILKLVHATIRSLLKSGWLTEVEINQPGTVTDDLYAQAGTLPAYASAASSKGGKHHKPPPALLLARGVGSTKLAGPVYVLLHPTYKGRSVLKHDRRIKVVLLITLRTRGGARLSFARRRVTLVA